MTDARNAASGVEILGAVTAEARNAASGVEVLGVLGPRPSTSPTSPPAPDSKLWSGGVLYNIQITS
jgi:hypothetical protein